MSAGQNMQLNEGRLPIPDPTPMTTAALDRALSSLREILETNIEGVEQLLKTRLDGMDKAVDLLQDRASLQPGAVDAKILNLRTLHEEKFDSVQKQFTERDTRTDQQASSTKLAVDAALQAVKEAGAKQQDSSDKAIAKSEAATTKQIDAIVDRIAANTKASDDKINDLKERISLMIGKQFVSEPATAIQTAEHKAIASTQMRTSGQTEGRVSMWQAVVGAVALVAALLAIEAKFDKPSTSQTPQVVYMPAPAIPVVPAIPAK